VTLREEVSNGSVLPVKLRVEVLGLVMIVLLVKIPVMTIPVCSVETQVWVNSSDSHLKIAQAYSDGLSLIYFIL
jgi:hypothetical protein|tara:strand:+ start:157 stop:378 length:222 start_codon:yes stop_codon:yes gene_type:complete